LGPHSAPEFRIRAMKAARLFTANELRTECPIHSGTDLIPSRRENTSGSARSKWQGNGVEPLSYKGKKRESFYENVRTN
jgi:hypothetical protein